MYHTLKITEAGEMKIISQDGVTRYEIKTKEMYFRGGKSYSENKVVEVISGTVWLLIPRNITEESFPFLKDNKMKLEPVEDDEDDYTFILPLNTPFIIPADVPHLFYSKSNSFFTEIFSITAEIVEYYRYRVMKEISTEQKLKK